MILASSAGDHMKRFVEGMDRQQSTLFPECLEDWIHEDNPVRVIDAFVEELDLSKLGFDGVSSRILCDIDGHHAPTDCDVVTRRGAVGN